MLAGSTPGALTSLEYCFGADSNARRPFPQDTTPALIATSEWRVMFATARSIERHANRQKPSITL